MSTPRFPDEPHHPALVPLPVSQPPARFEAWDQTLHTRAYEIWSSIGARDAGRTHLLLVQEYGEDTPLPAASTIRGWAAAERWSARADADLSHSHGRTLYELQVGWLAGLRLAQATLLDAMAGAFDDLPMGGASRIKSAEVVLRTIERAGLLAVLPQRPKSEDEDEGRLSTQEQHARALGSSRSCDEHGRLSLRRA